jgi:hypothetical protein
LYEPGRAKKRLGQAKKRLGQAKKGSVVAKKKGARIDIQPRF